MNMRACLLIAGLVLGVSAIRYMRAQEQSNAADNNPLTVRSSLVWVPALVKTNSGESVFSLTADDFLLTDNGIPQRLRLEQDSDAQPLALAIVVETGGAGAKHLRDYRHLNAVLDNVIGTVAHRVAVVGFDSHPILEEDFTDNTDLATEKLASLSPGDDGGAILDALKYSVELLRSQPPQYRRAILLITETMDGGSETSFEDALRLVGDTNTAIYSFGFSSMRSALSHEASKLPRPGGTPYSDTPYPPGGCMAKDADPDAHGSRRVQALDCASDLFPPLRLARLAFISARDGIERNVPEQVAELTGGEYFAFKNEKDLRADLVSIANDVPNRYLLSFSPHAPQPGLHALHLALKGGEDYAIKARTAYWVDAPSKATADR